MEKKTRKKSKNLKRIYWIVGICVALFVLALIMSILFIHLGRPTGM